MMLLIEVKGDIMVKNGESMPITEFCGRTGLRTAESRE